MNNIKFTAPTIFCHGIIFFILLILIDYWISNKYRNKDKKTEKTERIQLPEDINVEQHRELTNKIWQKSSGTQVTGAENQEPEYYIEVKDLKKVYNEFAAIKNNTFCVQKGEVFGLLGPNGAGKSTTFNVLSMKT